jgi:16S rRNA (cytosine1402-N4)-methyltransferase
VESVPYHVPVLADAVRSLAAGRYRIVDATVGGGGHASLLRDAGADLLAVDRDPDAIAAARERLGDAAIQWVQGDFSASDVLEAVGRFAPDMVLLDLGVSSRQLDEDLKGFSFRPGVPLDMRMAGTGPSAAELLNSASVSELVSLFRTFGDERRATRLARTIVERRARAPLVTSDDLVNAIRRALGPRCGPSDFARLFQAVRITVNQELSGLETALPALRDALTGGGVLAVITYHSGEDRIVKHAFRDWSRWCICPPAQPVCRCRGVALGEIVARKPIVASPAEVANNHRARSAKLRAFRKAND